MIGGFTKKTPGGCGLVDGKTTRLHDKNTFFGGESGNSRPKPSFFVTTGILHPRVGGRSKSKIFVGRRNKKWEDII